MSIRINYQAKNPQAINQMAEVSKYLQAVDKKLRLLIELRVSQINGCCYCIDLHTNQARSEGENQQRLDCLSAWTECAFFTEKEQAALAWTEAVTEIAKTHVSDTLYERLKTHFSEEEIVDLTLIIAQMNAWNRLAISLKKMPTKRN